MLYLDADTLYSVECEHALQDSDAEDRFVTVGDALEMLTID